MSNDKGFLETQKGLLATTLLLGAGTAAMGILWRGAWFEANELHRPGAYDDESHYRISAIALGTTLVATCVAGLITTWITHSKLFR